MSDSFAYDVFISYSSKDRAWVRNDLLRRLEAAGLKVCIDYRDFRIGAPSVSEMERAVTTSRKTLLVLTPDYLASAWTEFETLMLQTLDPANRALRLIPLRLKPCELPVRIGYLTYVDFANPDDVNLSWERLLGAFGAQPPAQPDSKLQPAGGVTEAGIDRLKLHRALTDRFSMEELAELCFDLGIDWDSIAGDNKPAKARELVQHYARRASLVKLRDAVVARRQDITDL